MLPLGILLDVTLFLNMIFRVPKFFVVGISWVQFSFLEANFMIQRFEVVGCMRKSDRKQKCIHASQIAHSTPNKFLQY